VAKPRPSVPPAATSKVLLQPCVFLLGAGDELGRPRRSALSLPAFEFSPFAPLALPRPRGNPIYSSPKIKDFRATIAFAIGLCAIRQDDRSVFKGNFQNFAGHFPQLGPGYQRRVDRRPPAALGFPDYP
jgi:hypothetical protein